MSSSFFSTQHEKPVDLDDTYIRDPAWVARLSWALVHSGSGFITIALAWLFPFFSSLTNLLEIILEIMVRLRWEDNNAH